MLVDHRRGDQVVALERQRGIGGVLVGMEADHLGRHHLLHQPLRIAHQQAAHRQHALEHTVFVDHENLVGLARQFVETAQVAQHHFAADVRADLDQLVVHQRADLSLFIG
ncbi:hypothetical protein D3C78_1354430 [compost metagenome]